jgi:hypothetical protein
VLAKCWLLLADGLQFCNPHAACALRQAASACPGLACDEEHHGQAHACGIAAIDGPGNAAHCLVFCHYQAACRGRTGGRVDLSSIEASRACRAWWHVGQNVQPVRINCLLTAHLICQLAGLPWPHRPAAPLPLLPPCPHQRSSQQSEQTQPAAGSYRSASAATWHCRRRRGCRPHCAACRCRLHLQTHC